MWSIEHLFLDHDGPDLTLWCSCRVPERNEKGPPMGEKGFPQNVPKKPPKWTKKPQKMYQKTLPCHMG